MGNRYCNNIKVGPRRSGMMNVATIKDAIKAMHDLCEQIWEGRVFSPHLLSWSLVHTFHRRLLNLFLFQF